MGAPNYVQPLSFNTGTQQGANFNWDSVFPRANYVDQLGGQQSQFQLPSGLNFASGMGEEDWLSKLGGMDGLLGNLGNLSKIGGNLMTGWGAYKQIGLAEKNAELQRKLLTQNYENQAKKLNDEVRRRNMVGSVSGFGKTGAGGRYVKESLA